MSPFLWRKPLPNGGASYLHWCAGCGHGHTYQVKQPTRPNWTFNGSIDKPTFTPSMRVFLPAHGEGMKHSPEQTICHYFLTDGMIRYLPDCQHRLAGKTMPLEPIPE